MKLCSSSHYYKSIINIILDDNVKKFNLAKIKNFTGQIDKKPLLNFCLESNSIKILKKIVNNQEVNQTLVVNKNTIKLLLKNEKLNLSEKMYIYTKIIQIKLKISDSWLLKSIVKYDIKALILLNKSKNLTYSDYKLIFSEGINMNMLNFFRTRKIDIIKLLIKINKTQPLDIENYIHLFLPEELDKLIKQGLKSLKGKDVDINLLDSIIKILIQHQYLIDKVDTALLKKIHLEYDQFFDFLAMDIEKLLLYKKFSQKKFKDKVNKI